MDGNMFGPRSGIMALNIVMRDDFSTKTIELLAKRVGYLCSNPLHRAPTIGPGHHDEKTMNVGVAAHITAASSSGAET